MEWARNKAGGPLLEEDLHIIILREDDGRFHKPLRAREGRDSASNDHNQNGIIKSHNYLPRTAPRRVSRLFSSSYLPAYLRIRGETFFPSNASHAPCSSPWANASRIFTICNNNPPEMTVCVRGNKCE